MSSKLREALLEIHNQLKDRLAGRVTHESMELRIKNIINGALAEPLRNCDVGTVEEQEKRFHSFCNRYTVVDAQHCNGCPINNIQTEADCLLVWSQLPYDETKGEMK